MISARIEAKRLAILGILRSSERPLSGSKITTELMGLGYDMSERTVRHYLINMDREGLTENFGKRGRKITAKGMTELEASRIVERVGFFSARIDRMTYLSDFDLPSQSGKVVVNITHVSPQDLAPRIDQICQVYEKGYAVGSLVSLLKPGERLGHIVTPADMIGIGTVCSISFNAVLLQYGIPTHSRFGGLLELHEGRPTRFVEMITYEGTSIDPLEVFIRSGMTDYLGAIRNGNGRVGASFREFPAESRDQVTHLAEKMEKVGLGGFMRIGQPGQPLLEIPVSEGRVGAIFVGGLNPVSILEETGVRVYSRAMAGLLDFSRLFHYEQILPRIQQLS